MAEIIWPRYRMLKPCGQVLVWVHIMTEKKGIPSYLHQLDGLTGMDESTVHQAVEELKDLGCIKTEKKTIFYGSYSPRPALKIELADEESKDYARRLYQLVTE